MIKDLGGIKNIYGMKIKKRILIRSSRLCSIGKTKLTRLQQLKLQKIIDLRTDEEKEKFPDPLWNNVQYLSIPFENVKNCTLNDSTKESSASKLPSMAEEYIELVLDNTNMKQMSHVLHEIINAEGPVLFHCAGGRDRTGIIAMLLLSLLDVDDKIIIKNYINSYEHRVIDKIKFGARLLLYKRKDIKKKIAERFYIDKNDIIAAISAIDKTYLSRKNYFNICLGLDDEDIIAFKKRVLT